MSILSRFFGRKAEESDHHGLVAIEREQAPALTVLFSTPYVVDAEALTTTLRGLDASLQQARVEVDAALSQEGRLFGLLGWGEHVVQLVGFAAPMPADALEACVAPAHYSQEDKAVARSHQAHIILYYAGASDDVWAQYAALTAVAGALAQQGAVIVVNEAAHTSLPLAVLRDPEVLADYMGFIESLPLLLLFCGLVKYEVAGTAGVWMRTFGAEYFGLPNFAALAAGHDEGRRYSDIFENVLFYLHDSGAQMVAGNTMQIGENEFFRLRAPAEAEYFLQDDAPLLVADIIGAGEINVG